MVARLKMFRTILPYAIVVLLAYVGFSLPLPIFPEMFLDAQRSIISDLSLQKKMLLLGLMMASFPLGQFFGSPILGRFSDRYGRKRVVLSSLFGTTLGYLITAYSAARGSVLGMFVGMVVCGFCEGNGTIAQSVIADLTDREEQKAKYFGILNIFISVGFIIGPLMGGQLADPSVVSWFTFATPFWAAALMTLLGICIIYFTSRETLKLRGKEKWHFFSSALAGFKRPRLPVLYFANFFLALGYFSFFRFFPVFLERRFDFSAAQLANVMVYSSIMIMFGVIWLIPFLTKRMTALHSLALFALLTPLAFMAALLIRSPHMLWWVIPPIGLCLAVLITNGSVIISSIAPKNFQGQALGTLTSVQVLAEFFTGLFGGAIASDKGLLPMIIGAGMSVVAACILFFLGRRREKLS